MKQRGVIAAGHPETARAAAQILEDGGNAFDAVLAGLCTACIAEPVLASLGGGGFLMARPAGRDPVVYDFFPQTPLKPLGAAEIDLHPVLADFGTAQQEFHVGMGAIATPGMVKGLFRVHRDLASLPMTRIVEHAAGLAREGCPVNAMQASILEIVAPIFTANAACRAAFGSSVRSGRPMTADEDLVLPDFADTLEALCREGEVLFYRGGLAEKLVADCRSGGGQLTRADLERYEVALRTPLNVAVNGARVMTNPPPSAGGILIAFGLQLLRGTGLAKLGFGSAAYLERLATAMALTNKARVESELRMAAAGASQAILSPEFVAAYRAQILGKPTAMRGTTQISVIDGGGNAASLTVTNGEGATYILPGTGIMMNNMLGEEDINPQGFYRWPSDTRLCSMMAPSLVLHGSGGVEALGSGGSKRIRTALLQVLLHRLEEGVPLEDSVNRPRIHLEDQLLSVEPGFAEAELAGLAEHFPEIERWEAPNMFFGGTHCVLFDPATGRFEGAGDPRRGGVAVVV